MAIKHKSLRKSDTINFAKIIVNHELNKNNLEAYFNI